MKLLRNQKLILEPEKLTYLPFHEMRILIESILELCQEGEITFYEAHNIVLGEGLLSMEYSDMLEEKLDDLENDIIGLDDDEKFNRDCYREHYKNAFGEMQKYYNFVAKSREMLLEILENKEYQQNRKAKIKAQIIRDGLSIFWDKDIASQEKTDPTPTPEEKRITSPGVGYPTIYLFGLFPKFEIDYQLLISKKFMEEDKEGLHWKKSKQSLAEYFKSIKPQEMEKIPWKAIERAFCEKDLKNSASTNGNSFKNTSENFKELLNIKNDTTYKNL